MVKTLFEQGANPDLQDIFGKSPLHVAAAKGNIAVIKPLIEGGANPYKKDKWGNTPLDVADGATIWYMKKVVKDLLDGGADLTRVANRE